jgi:2-keto-4-pentenoate hydratase/2-oxohepta-3-ene-1,7-dioic acid hydratase in catechol pathway
MTTRYVRVKTLEQQIHYGLLQIDHRVQILDAPPWLQGQLTDQILEQDAYELLAPCVPSKIIAIGKNFSQHIQELGMSMPVAPILSMKPTTTVIADRGTILHPPQSQQVETEAELAIVIGEKASQCHVEQAAQKIWGYTIANDVTARDLQFEDEQWVRAKGFDSFCPLGPWVIREINPHAQVQTYLNDELCRNDSLSGMLFSPTQLVAYVSQVMTLWPGDVILSGALHRVGPMQIGDRVRIAIEGIGCLENVVGKR